MLGVGWTEMLVIGVVALIVIGPKDLPMMMQRLGKVIGTRTWGGVIGIWPRHLLVDGTETTQPEYSFWFRDVGWGVENHGTDPNIEVDNAPQDAAAGFDRQLHTALDTALRLAESARPDAPQMDRRPNLSMPPLPPLTPRG